jgi:hypothetical protein
VHGTTRVRVIKAIYGARRGVVCEYHELINGRERVVGRIQKPLEKSIAPATEARHSLAFKPDSTVIAWGQNAYAQTNAPGTLYFIMSPR